jgi:hypothetical protein
VLPVHVLNAVDEVLAEQARRAPVGSGYLYHETARGHLGEIAREGLRSMSYGQSFVCDDATLSTPEEELTDIRAELEDDAMMEDVEVHPPEDLVPRTYVLLDEPRTLNYADVLLRFPRVLARPTKRYDVDWYVKETVPADQIEALVDGAWWRIA